MRTPGSTGRVARWLMAIGGVASFGLGGLGIVVPGLPTTVFVLLGSYLLTRSCPWIEERLANTPLFRPYARYVDPAVPMPRPVKVRAVGAMWFFITVSIFMTPRLYSSAMNRDATPVGRCPRDRIKPKPRVPPPVAPRAPACFGRSSSSSPSFTSARVFYQYPCDTGRTRPVTQPCSGYPRWRIAVGLLPQNLAVGVKRARTRRSNPGMSNFARELW